MITSQLRALQRQWMMVVVITTILSGFGFIWLQNIWQPASALRWVIIAGLVLLYELILLWRHLPENHPPDDPSLRPSLGLGNSLSLLRALFMGWMAGFLFSPWPSGWMVWLPGILYTAAAIVDIFDGLVARRTNSVTVLGATLDLEYDALGVLIAPVLAVWYGQLPVWYLLVSGARYLFVAGLWIHRRRGRPTYDLPPSTFRRLMAAFTMAIVSVALWPVIGPMPLWICATVFMVPVSVGFIRDYLISVGLIDANSPSYQRTIERSMIIFTEWLPLLWRACVLIGLIFLVQRQLASLTTYSWLGTNTPQWTIYGLIFVEVTTGLLIVIGLMARTLAIILAFYLGVVSTHIGLDAVSVMIIIGSIMVLLMGSGHYSLWTGENRFLAFPET